MANTKKLIQAAAGAAGGAALNVEDVFSTYLYEGAGSTQTITNGIDLAGEGGLVWMKNRDAATNHRLYTTDLYSASNSNLLQTNLTTGGGNTGSFEFQSFNSDGFTLGYSGGGYSESNGANTNYASWTFRKAPKFFDVVTFSTTTGSSTPITVNHNLGSVPGMIIVKTTSTTGGWFVFHRSLGSTKYLELGSTDQAQTGGTSKWASAPTSTSFTLGGDFVQNATYVAYLFAHNNGDGDFGPTGDQDIIKCGSYTGTGSNGNFVDLGFEPQWIMVKRTNSTGNWIIVDNMRSLSHNDYAWLYPNTSDAEGAGASSIGLPSAEATGFTLNGSSIWMNASGSTYIYIAIRRGPMAVPESATDVFAIDEGDGVGAVSAYTSGFPVDFAIDRTATATSPNYVATRLLQGTRLQTDGTNAEASESAFYFDYMEGWRKFARAAGNYSWMWKRAPKYFDVVAYTGDGTAGRTISHNLGVAPEMMWVKKRSGVESWAVYHSLNGGTHFARLQGTNAYVANSNVWDNTDTTASVFTVDTDTEVNQSGQTYIAYLFASLDGVSKVGSYTGNGTSQTIDCGFSSGARFVLIKRSDSSGDWNMYDTERGIVAGNDSRLSLNTTDAEDTSNDRVDAYSSGFTVNYIATGTSDSNISGATYIFYAIA
jgi:hypothetical protein